MPASAFVRGGIAVLASLAGGCGTSGFACTDDDDCRDGAVAGICEPDARCSFPDGQCPSGRRYGAHAGAQSNACVDDTMVASTGTSTTGSTPVASTTGAENSSTTDISTTSHTTNDTSTTADTTPIGVDLPPEVEPLVWLDFADAAAPFTNRGSLGGEATCPPTECPQPSVGGGAATFDGDDDCLEFAHDAALTSEGGLTATLWIRLDVEPPLSAVTTAMGKPLGNEGANSWAIFWGAAGNGDLQVFGAVNNMRGETRVGAGFGPVGAWVHVALTHDGATAALYSGGELVDSAIGTGIGFDGSSVFIGCDDDGGGVLEFHVTGALADVRVYDRVLALDEIAALAAVPPES